MKDCLACDLTSEKKLPGGRIYATKNWVVEHCIGPLGVGTLIVKPFRHCTRFWELNSEEVQELGPLLHKISSAIHSILNPDQIYICLWSHAEWKPGHIHFVLQPSWNHLQQQHDKPGPFLQLDMFTANELPPRNEIEELATRIKVVIQSLNKLGI
jgi:diadenosine tetraphosphate (Ap4A) HIT family hydrolase